MILTEMNEKYTEMKYSWFFLSKSTDDLDRNLWKSKKMYLNEMQYIPSVPFFRQKDYQRIMWQNFNLTSKMKENSLERLSSIIGRKKSEIIHDTVYYNFRVSVQCFEIEFKLSSVLKINYLSSYTTAIHTSVAMHYGEIQASKS